MPFAPIQLDSCIRYNIIVILVYDRDRDRDRDRDLNKHHVVSLRPVK